MNKKLFFVRYQNPDTGEERRVFSGGIFERPDAPPDRLPLIVEGTYYDYMDDAIPTIQIDDKFLSACLANFRFDAGNRVYLPVDQNHALAWGMITAEGLAMIDELTLEGEPGARVLVGRVRYWTEDGAKKAVSGGLPYISIAPFFTPHPSTGESPWLQSVALCASPYMRNIGPYLALTSSSAAGQGRQQRGVEDMSKRLFAILGLPPDATEDQAVIAMTAVNAGAAGFAAVLKHAGLDGDGITPERIGEVFTAAAIAPLLTAAGLPETAGADALRTRIEALTLSAGNAQDLAATVARNDTELRALKAEKVVKRAKTEGLIAPAKLAEFTAKAKKDPDAAALLLDDMASLGATRLPVNAPARPDADPPAEGAQFSAGAVALAKKLGKDEKWLAANAGRKTQED